jgi:hypothetical protein
MPELQRRVIELVNNGNQVRSYLRFCRSCVSDRGGGFPAVDKKTKPLPDFQSRDIQSRDVSREILTPTRVTSEY